LFFKAFLSELREKPVGTIHITATEKDACDRPLMHF
jgi:hypothetical protein